MPGARRPGNSPEVKRLAASRCSVRRLLICFVITVVYLPISAEADRGDWSAGVSSSLGKPSGDPALAWQLETDLRLGLTDWVALEAFGAFRVHEGPGAGVGLGLVVMADIFQWVPELALGGLIHCGQDGDGAWATSAGVRAELRGRYFLSMKSAIFIRGGLTWLASGHTPFVGGGWLYLLD